MPAVTRAKNKPRRSPRKTVQNATADSDKAAAADEKKKAAAAAKKAAAAAKKAAAAKSAFKYDRNIRLSEKLAAAVDEKCVCKLGNKTFKPFQLGSRTQVNRGTKQAVVPAQWLAGGARKSPKRSGARKSPKRSGARKSPKRRSGARKSPKRRSGARKSGARK
jgi:colicin import membrane protein